MKRKRVNLSITDGIAMVLLDRPEVLNALDQQMWEELVNVFRSATNDPKVRVVIISGIGRGFCVGADLKEVAWRGESQIQSRRRIEANNQQLAREMIGAPMPIIAAINGYALGGGSKLRLLQIFELPALKLASDFRKQQLDASFQAVPASCYQEQSV